MTHKDLVKRMAKWLKNTKSMTVVMAELTTRNSEIPDVIGWVGNAHSILIEAKVSRADFVTDAHKHFRRESCLGMGAQRYVASPRGMLTPDEMPEGWGLLEVDEHRVRVSKEAEYMEANKCAECVMLMSALRRLEISTAVYVVHDDTAPKAGGAP